MKNFTRSCFLQWWKKGSAQQLINIFFGHSNKIRLILFWADDICTRSLKSALVYRNTTGKRGKLR